MALQDIASIPLDTESFFRWSFANMAAHRDIVRVIYQQQGVQLDENPLDPFNPFDGTSFSNWLSQHQNMHRMMNDALGVTSNNLLDLDWTDLEMLQGWMLQHFSEHDQAATILNLG